MITKQVSDISCESDHFNTATGDCNTALKSDFSENIKYLPSQSKQRNRKREIIWFNPCCSVNVKTNFGKLSLRLIDKRFPCRHKFHKFFNHYNIKVSCSCMPSMKNVIQKHNSKIMQNPKSTDKLKVIVVDKKSNCPIMLSYNAVL